MVTQSLSEYVRSVKFMVDLLDRRPGLSWNQILAAYMRQYWPPEPNDDPWYRRFMATEELGPAFTDLQEAKAVAHLAGRFVLLYPPSSVRVTRDMTVALHITERVRRDMNRKRREAGRDCQHCGQEFRPQRLSAVYCSSRCRVAAHRNRHTSE